MILNPNIFAFKHVFKLDKMTVLVSGFIDISLYDPVQRHKSIDFYLEMAKPFLCLPHPKIVFLEQEVIDRVQSTINPLTTMLVPFEKEKLWLWPRREHILTAHLPINRSHHKDTHDYMMIQLQKTRWMKLAAALDSTSDHFVWVDFGIFHIINNLEVFEELFSKLVTRRHTLVRIASGWTPGTMNTSSVMKGVMWYFLGGLFGGSRQALVEFDRLVECEVNALLSESQITWEVNVWYLVYCNHPELFDWYSADHNTLMIRHY